MSRFGDIRWLVETDSTNRVVLDLVRQGAPEGVVVVADHQTAGRGRRNRTWVAPPGSSLLVSVLLRPTVAWSRLHLLTISAALAAAEACFATAGVRPALKWPNDVVVEGRGKLAGLLAESVTEGGQLVALVVGMGLNLHCPEGGFPEALTNRAVALDELTLIPDTVDRDRLLEAWLSCLDDRLDHLDAVLDDYRSACSTLGRRVRVEMAPGQPSVVGQAVDVTEEGHLIVREQCGLDHVLAWGEVVHLRDA